MTKGNVLLTGGSGFIASHILALLLQDGYTVVITVRSRKKGDEVLESLSQKQRNSVSYKVVEDISKPEVFDPVVAGKPFDYVIHTASPCRFIVDDPIKDILEPAIKGTTGILQSVKTHGASTVQRVVLTSSAAALVIPDGVKRVYNETFWAPSSWEYGMPPAKAYKASKVLAETAAWEFMKEEKPDFSLAVINNTWTFGPIQPQITELENVNMTNDRIRDMMLGKMKEKLASTSPVFTFVDVRDVALAHIRAMTVPEAAGQRFFVVAGHFTNSQIVETIRQKHPELEHVLPSRADVEELPDDTYDFDNSKSREVLGIEYRSLNECIGDAAESILAVMVT